jgi:NAD(P)-dependent dehydrogenase (short-subunit alcohol dehydrogenase family)
VRLDGRHALVTGGGRGIGAAIARALTGAGAAVTVLGRNEGLLCETVKAGAAAGYVTADVTRADALGGAISLAEAARGPVAILVNNAGAVETAPFVRLGRDLWDRMIALNLTSVFEACRIILPGMVERGFGRIVNVASTAGLKGYAYIAAYCAAKHGVVGLTRALALETAKTGVTVNAVCPGYTETDLVSGSIEQISKRSGRAPAEVKAELVKANPQGRLVTPDEVAEAVLFLCGPRSGSLTGQAIAVAGGEVM